MQPLRSGPRAQHDTADILSALKHEGTPRTRWGVEVLNTDDLLPTGVTLQLIDGDVNWSYRVSEEMTGGVPTDAKVRRTGNLRVRNLENFNFLGSYYRPWIEIQSPTSGAWIKWYLGTFMVTNPPYRYDGFYVVRELELADLGHLLQTDQLITPLSLPHGTHVVEWLRTDMQMRYRWPPERVINVGRAHNVFDDIRMRSKRLDDDLFFEAGESRLDIYNSLLSYIGCDPLWFNEVGQPVSFEIQDPELRQAEWEYSPGTTVLPQASIEAVNPELPNVITFVASRGPSLPEEGNGIRTVRNEQDGPGSIVQRGREVPLRVEVDAQSQEELDAIAKRRAQYLFAGGGLRYVGSVGLNPAHSNEDIVHLRKPVLGVDGNWVVTAWTHRLGPMNSPDAATTRIEMEYVTGAALTFPVGVYPGTFASQRFAVGMFINREGEIVLPPPPVPDEPPTELPPLTVSAGPDVEGFVGENVVLRGDADPEGTTSEWNRIAGPALFFPTGRTASTANVLLIGPGTSVVRRTRTRAADNATAFDDVNVVAKPAYVETPQPEYRVAMVYVAGSDESSVGFYSPTGQVRDGSWVDRIGVMADVVQRVCGYMMQQQGYGDKSFNLDRDPQSGRPNVYKLTLPRTTAQLRNMTESEILALCWDEWYTNGAGQTLGFKVIPVGINQASYYNRSTKKAFLDGGLGYVTPPVKSGSTDDWSTDTFSLSPGHGIYAWPKEFSAAALQEAVTNTTFMDTFEARTYVGWDVQWAHATTIMGIVLHELGHTLGLRHPGYQKPTTPDDEYDEEPLGVMGYGQFAFHRWLVRPEPRKKNKSTTTDFNNADRPHWKSAGSYVNSHPWITSNYNKALWVPPAP